MTQRFIKGEYVKTWFNDGLGGTVLYGRVVESGPVAFKVRWESGLHNRRKHDEPGGVERITSASHRDAAAQAMKPLDA